MLVEDLEQGFAQKILPAHYVALESDGMLSPLLVVFIHSVGQVVAMLHFLVISLRRYCAASLLPRLLLNMTLEDFILEHFGTKELAARRLKVTRWTLYRWLDQPGNIQLRYYKRLADITDTNIDTIISYGLKNNQPADRTAHR
jgi:hypothetical protein